MIHRVCVSINRRRARQRDVYDVRGRRGGLTDEFVRASARSLVCVCVWEGVDRKRKGCCSTVFTRVPAGRLCVRRRLFFPRPPVAHNRKLLVNLPFMSREMQFGSSPRIYPSLVSVSGLSPRALNPPPPHSIWPTTCALRRQLLHIAWV